MSETPAAKADKKKAPRTEAKLKKPHTHAGKHYDAEAVKAGATINVTDRQKKRLSKHGII